MSSIQKTIICIGGFKMPDKNAAAHRVLNDAKALKEYGYNTVFIDIDKNADANILNTLNVYSEFDTYSISNTRKRAVNIDDFKKIYDVYKNNVVGVIAYNYPSLALLKLSRFCKKNNIFIAGDVTEWYEASGKNLLFRIIKKIDIDMRMKVIHPRLDGIIAISNYLSEYYSKDTEVVRIPPLTDNSSEKCEKDNDLRSDNTLRIVYAGSPGYTKDKLNRIIEGIYKCNYKKILFIIIGITEKQFLEYYPEEKEILKKLGNNIIFKGRVSHDEVIENLNSSDYTLFYREETRLTKAGFPTKFSESISCGIPVITNGSSDLSEYITGDRNGFLLSTEKFVEDLPELLDELTEGKIDKPTVDKDLFDYHNYVSKLGDFIKKIEYNI